MTPSSSEAIGLQQSLGCGRSSIHFFFSREMTRSFAKGLVIPRLSLWGEMPFTKVCVEPHLMSCLLIIVYYHFATQTNIYVESLKEDEAREPKKAKNKACEQDSLSRT